MSYIIPLSIDQGHYITAVASSDDDKYTASSFE